VTADKEICMREKGGGMSRKRGALWPGKARSISSHGDLGDRGNKERKRGERGVENPKNPKEGGERETLARGKGGSKISEKSLEISWRLVRN